MKKLLSLVLAVVMVLGLVACGNGGSETTAPAENDPAAAASYTYKSYMTALGTNWNPHAWEMSNEQTILSYLETPLAYMTIENSEDGVYQWVYDAATYVKDVTAENKGDLTKYAVTLPEGQTAETTESGYVFEIGLNPDMAWENGTPINADTYIYSMKALLDPAMKNYRANLYYDGESAVAGGKSYYNAGSTAFVEDATPLDAQVAGDQYTAANGDKLYFALTTALSWLGGETLETYVTSYGADYFDVAAYESLAALADEAGNVPVNAESLPLMTAVISVPAWGEGPGNEQNYVVAEHYYPECGYDETVGCYKVDDYTIQLVTVDVHEDMNDIKKHFDLFKVRASAGYTGKVSFSPFQAMTMYQYSNEYEYKNGIGAIPLTIGNVDLAWERTMNYNVGLDFSMFNKRLNIVVDAYIRNTTDLLLDKAKAPSTGVTTATSNLGEMQNKGVEIQVDGYIFRNSEFSWKLGTMGYFNRNKITKINKALEEINKENQENAGTSLAPLPQYAEGESTTALKLVRSAGIDPATGKEVYIKRDGTLTFDYDPTDRVLIGDTEPKYTGTFNTHIYWKGFSLYALFNFRLGAWIYNTTRITKVEGSDPMQNADQRVFDDRWKQPGDIAFYKNIADSSRPNQTDRFAEEENTLTLGTLNLSYEFPEKLYKPHHLRNLRAGINFTDILRLSSVKI